MQNFGTQKHYESCHDNHVMICHDTCHDTCHEVNNILTCHDSSNRLNKTDWQYLVDTLDKWRVFNPRAIVKKNPQAAWKCMNLCKDKGVRVPGAYFTACFRTELAKEAAHKNFVSLLEKKCGVA